MNGTPLPEAPAMSDPADLPTTALAAEDATTLLLDTEALAALAADAKTIATATPSQVSVNLERTGDFIGRYRLITVLGEGGFGTVWRAEQSEPIHREVALKVIKPGMDSREIIARFEAERQALALMDHPNIAGVLDAGTTDNGRPFFVMELVKGVPITDYCDAHQLTIRQRLELFIPVCQAVQHAHQKAILHRDLKPSNILVAEVDGKPVPKVIDFGIAKALGTSPEAALRGSLLQTQVGAIIGTPQYMSPEQAGAAQDLDTRSDIYTLGVILFELLTGDTPLSRETLRKAALDEMLRLIRESDHKRPSSRILPATAAITQTSLARDTEPGKLMRTLRGDLDWITLKALEKERNRRYESASALAQDLERHLNYEPVTAGPPSALYRFRKLVQRNRFAVVSAAAMTVLLLVGIAMTTWQAVRASQAENAAKIETQRASRAEHAARAQLEEASRSDRLIAADHFRKGELSEGFARLSRSLYYQPSATAAADLAVVEMNNLNAEPIPIHILLGHMHSVDCVQFSPNGKTVVTVSKDSTARLWDVTTGRMLSVLKGHRDRVLDARFSPDNICVATASADKTVKVWNLETGALIHNFQGHEGQVYKVRFSTDGRRVVSTSQDKTAKIWDVHTGTLVLTLKGHTSALCEAQFDLEGRRIVTASHDTARVWDAFTGGVLAVISGVDLRFNSASLSPDGEKILTSSNDGIARLWDAATGQLLSTLKVKVAPTGGSAPSTSFIMASAEFSPDGRHVLTASNDFKARIWDAFSGTLLITLNGHTGNINARYSPDGSLVVTSSWDSTARVWDAAGGKELAVLRGHHGSVMDAVFSPDCSLVATASSDGSSRIWDIGKGTIGGVLFGHTREVVAAHFSPDGRHIITGARDSSARIWDADNCSLIHVLQGHKHGLTSTSFSAAGDRALTACEGGTVIIWDASSGKVIHTLPGHNHRVDEAHFSENGLRVASVSNDGTARIWDVQSGSLLTTLTDPVHQEQSKHFPSSVHLSNDGRLIAATFAFSPVHVWDCENGKLLFSLGQKEEWGRSARFTQDGKRLLTANLGLTLTMWDVTTGASLFKLLGGVPPISFSGDGRRVFATGVDQSRTWDRVYGAGSASVWNLSDHSLVAELRGHSLLINSGKFSPDNRRIVTSSTDRTARIWDAATGKEQAVLRGHQDGVVHAEFSPDGERVLTASWDKTARIWHVLPANAATPPDWFQDLLHYLAQKRINTDGEFEMLKPVEWLAIRSKLQEIARTSDGGNNPYLRVLHRQMRTR